MHATYQFVHGASDHVGGDNDGPCAAVSMGWNDRFAATYPEMEKTVPAQGISINSKLCTLNMLLNRGEPHTLLVIAIVLLLLLFLFGVSYASCFLALHSPAASWQAFAMAPVVSLQWFLLW